MESEMGCPMCGGPGVELGALGFRVHFRCRDCGMEFSHVDEEARKREEKNRKVRERRQAMRAAADSVGARMVRGALGGRYYE